MSSYTKVKPLHFPYGKRRGFILSFMFNTLTHYFFFFDFNYFFICNFSMFIKFKFTSYKKQISWCLLRKQKFYITECFIVIIV